MNIFLIRNFLYLKMIWYLANPHNIIIDGADNIFDEIFDFSNISFPLIIYQIL